MLWQNMDELNKSTDKQPELNEIRSALFA